MLDSPPIIAAPPAIVTLAPAAPPVLAPGPHVQGSVEALVQDAREYARLYGVGLADALARLRAQEESVAVTDRLRVEFADRLAGIAIEHRPAYRIVVLLTGMGTVADRILPVGGMAVPIAFRTGAAATHDQLIAALTAHRGEIQAIIPGVAGIGVDPREGALVVTVKAKQAEPEGSDALAAQLSQAAGVPVRVRVMDRPEANFSVEGGGRVEGTDNGRRFACTSGFVVTDGAGAGSARTGIVTAAHCPYTLVYKDAGGVTVPLRYAGAWGARTQDVQVQLSDTGLAPLFFADREKQAARTVTSWRPRVSTRAGDVVCHRGERTGYSCAEVELTDYAPPGDLCGGPCEPVWVTVAGPNCGGGDSGGPVFAGTIAFGIVKGGSYAKDGRCNFYYYMSVDYLPTGWSLLHG